MGITTLGNKNALILVFINRSLMYNWKKTYTSFHNNAVFKWQFKMAEGEI